MHLFYGFSKDLDLLAFFCTNKISVRTLYFLLDYDNEFSALLTIIKKNLIINTFFGFLSCF